MRSINSQIGLQAGEGKPSRSAYFRSQPQLAVEDWSRDFINDYNMPRRS